MKPASILAALLISVVAAPDPTSAAKPPAHPAPNRASGKRMLGRAIRPVDAESPWIGEPISLDLKDADLRDVLHTFAELMGLNVAVDPEVKGSVTVRLHDVAWDQALDLILRTNGFGYVLEGNILRVGLPSKL